MAGTAHIDWSAALLYYLTLDPWWPGQLGHLGYERTVIGRALGPPSRRRTYANVARRFGVSRQAVQQHARAHGWAGQAAEFDREVHERVYGEPRRAPRVFGEAVRRAFADVVAEYREQLGLA